MLIHKMCKQKFQTLWTYIVVCSTVFMSIFCHLKLEQYSILCQHQHQKVHMRNSHITGLAMKMTQTHPATTFLLLSAKEKLPRLSFYIPNRQEQSVWYYISLTICLLVYKWVCCLWMTCSLLHAQWIFIDHSWSIYQTRQGVFHWWKCVYFSISQYKS